MANVVSAEKVAPILVKAGSLYSTLNPSAVGSGYESKDSRASADDRRRTNFAEAEKGKWTGVVLNLNPTHDRTKHVGDVLL